MGQESKTLVGVARAVGSARLERLCPWNHGKIKKSAHNFHVPQPTLCLPGSMTRLWSVGWVLAAMALAQTGLTPATGGSFRLQVRGYDLGKLPVQRQIRVTGDVFGDRARVSLHFFADPGSNPPPYAPRILSVDLKGPLKPGQTYRIGDPLNPQVRGTLSYLDDRNPNNRKSWGGSGSVTITALSNSSLTLQGSSIQMSSPKHGNFVMSFVLKVDRLRR